MSLVPVGADRLPTHSRTSAAIFSFKRSLLQIRRKIVDLGAGLRAYPVLPTASAPTHRLSEHRSALWSDAGIAERILQLGKVQNLRIALRKLNGLDLPSGALFSFWRQIGPATKLRGYAVGRELREGCLIPAVGGGLCQLSNALYAAALDAGAEIVERHAHSRVVPGSAAALGRDATVAYNYVDLRFRFNVAVQLECRLTGTDLIVRFLTAAPDHKDRMPKPKRPIQYLLEPRSIGSCVSCSQVSCFRNAPSRDPALLTERTSYLVDRCIPEFDEYIQSARSSWDSIFVPLYGERFGIARYAWSTVGFSQARSAPLQVARHALRCRLRHSVTAAAARIAHMALMDDLAIAYGRQLKPDQTHLVISQDLLPSMWRQGHLGGRTFDVLMNRLPIAVLQERLDAALNIWPDSPTLGDFRAPLATSHAESEALAAASRIITSHPELARLFGDRTTLLPGKTPRLVGNPNVRRSGPVALVFPGPSVARKGCYAVREAARALDIDVFVLGDALECPNFWDGVKVRSVAPGDESWLANNVIVVQPSLWEESPRLLLRALAAGIPVIGTSGCGLGERDGLSTVTFGNCAEFFETVAPLSGKMSQP